MKVTQIPIPDGKTVEETWRILHLILEAVPPGCRLTLDLTHGYRSFPFLFFTAALYLKALRSVHIEAAYYAMVDVAGEGEKPVVDLSLILDMVEWFYAGGDDFLGLANIRHLFTVLKASSLIPDLSMPSKKPLISEISISGTRLIVCPELK